MAKIRQIKPGFYSSPKLAQCSVNARFTFIGLLIFSDDHGVHQADPLRLRMEVFPGDNCTVESVSNWINELISVGLISTFNADNETFWHIVNFSKHQKVVRPYYCFPAPPFQSIDTTQAISTQPCGMDEIEYEHNTNIAQAVLVHEVGMAQTLLRQCSNTPGNGNVNGNGNGTNTGKVKTLPLALSDNSFCASNAVHQSDDPVQAVFVYWCKVMNHPRAKLDKLRQTRIVQALALGYSVDELKQAIDGCMVTPFNMGNNDRKQRYDGLDLILRDADHIDRFIANALNPPGEENHDADVNSFMRGVL